MKTENFKLPWRAFARKRRGGWPCVTVMAVSLLIAGKLMAMPTVKTLTGGPSQFYPQTSYGYQDGDTATTAKFHTPYGLALDSTGNNLFVADRDNNAVRQLDLAGNQTYTFVPNAFVPASLISKPVGVALDGAGNVYVLNRGNDNNGTVLQFDTFGDLVKTNATGLTNAAGIALDGLGNIYLTVRSNTLIRITPAGVTTTIATITNANTSLQGIVVKHNGSIAACDSGRHGIYLINPDTGVVTTNAGFHGAGDFTTANNVSSSSTAMFNQPYGVTEAGNGTLVVTDYGNHRVKVVLTSGVVTNLYGVSSNYWVGPLNPAQGIYPGWWDGTVAVPDSISPVEARQPVGVVFASDGTLYTTEVYYHLIRKVTSTGLPPPPPPPPAAPTILTVTTNFGQVTLSWSAVAGTTNYVVKRSTSSGGPYTTIGTTTATTFTDTTVLNGTTYFYGVSAANTGGESPNSAEVSATPPLPPVPDPQIGYVDFPAFNYTSVFHPVTSYDFFNDAIIVIKGTPGSATYYEYRTDGSPVPNPTTASASVPSDYQDGLFPVEVVPFTVGQVSPFLTVKVIGAKGDGSPNSAVVQGNFQFRTGNPNINGNNAALFTISDITANAHLYYTLDGSDPSSTNANAVDLGTVATPTNVWTVSLNIQSNTTFKVRAFRNNYQPSALVTNIFSLTNFVANKISFGFEAGEASSAFVAASGQRFYAPVTLTVLPQATMYSLQFNLTVTNAGPNPGPALAAGAVNFESMLAKPFGTNKDVFVHIPPLMFSGYAVNPPPPSQITNIDGIPFVNMVFITNNLLGVGWLERHYSQGTNLYDSVSQDLITFSIAHDTLFNKDDGKVIVGGYGFQVPPTATDGQTYQIQIGRPSATADGIGAPGSDVVIDTPTNGSLTNGAINSIKNVTIGVLKYLAGDSAPFRWFNAGDFGNSTLVNDDVMQVFQSAVYRYNTPPPGSDLFDSMDSCGSDLLAAVPSFGDVVLETSPGLPLAPNDLFFGTDTDIDRVAFGDGLLDVADVYVTFRRSLDPNRVWYQRFWTNGVRAAERATNVFRPSGGSPDSPVPSYTYSPDSPAVSFACTDVVATNGQTTIQVPIKARIQGGYPLRVLMLNLTVQPLDGSPALTDAVQFTPDPALGTPTVTSARGLANYAAAWLNSYIAGLTGTSTIGRLTIKVPASATGFAAYSVHFDHASASPNGIAVFPEQVRSGLVTLSSDRSGSSFNDGIPDSWRLRWFGTVNNLLSGANADADGDGASNWHEYKAGTDPNDPKSILRLGNNAAAGPECVVKWPTIADKQYVIEKSATMFAPDWIPVSTNAGTGWEMEYHDTSPTAGACFYRVRVP